MSDDLISRQAVLDNSWELEYPDGTSERVVSLKEIKALPSVTPQESKTGYLSIDDVMSVFDDFMCGEVDEEGTETFLEMLKDKAESERE